MSNLMLYRVNTYTVSREARGYSTPSTDNLMSQSRNVNKYGGPNNDLAKTNVNKDGERSCPFRSRVLNKDGR